mmetsp:Transcript_90814/g.253717  ORF Transcript_90814/g.253717 Transcript_90814/m.253717 type:complete len:285 (+) Transcript_90814:228-1082(+)
MLTASAAMTPASDEATGPVATKSSTLSTRCVCRRRSAPNAGSLLEAQPRDYAPRSSRPPGCTAMSPPKRSLQQARRRAAGSRPSAPRSPGISARIFDVPHLALPTLSRGLSLHGTQPHAIYAPRRRAASSPRRAACEALRSLESSSSTRSARHGSLPRPFALPLAAAYPKSSHRLTNHSVSFVSAAVLPTVGLLCSTASPCGCSGTGGGRSLQAAAVKSHLYPSLVAQGGHNSPASPTSPLSIFCYFASTGCTSPSTASTSQHPSSALPRCALALGRRQPTHDP